MAVATVHPIGQAHQIPVLKRAVFDKTIARTTLNIRSVNVIVLSKTALLSTGIINCYKTCASEDTIGYKFSRYYKIKWGKDSQIY